MKDKKTGLLFPETNKPSPKPSPKKSPKKTSMENALTNIQETKDRQSRLKIITRLINSKEPWVGKVLIQALDDPCEDIRKIIVTDLSTREDLDLTLLYQRLRQTPWYVKTGCLRILGLRKNTSSLKHIESMANDPNIEVRRTLAIVLGEIGGKKALAILAKLSEDDSPFVRTPALQSLREVSQVKFS
ncbi:MAG: HEAT repeat domain-containing protein [Candidatus Aminicenantes bacterium]|nr:MAG: HEAT repeat domain-containing protein [Candidatus Aminicenantes bacterium]